MMTNTFTEDARKIAKEIIELSRRLDDELETWDQVIVRVPDSTSKDVSAGYVSKPDATSGIEMVLDVQAPPEEDWARLRIWTIETTIDNAGNERFNNIQLTYSLDKSLGREFVEHTRSLDREVLAKLIDDPETKLSEIVVSDQTGKDKVSGERLGKRHEIDSVAINSLSTEDQNQVKEALSIVIERLKLGTENKKKEQ